MNTIERARKLVEEKALEWSKKLDQETTEVVSGDLSALDSSEALETVMSTSESVRLIDSALFYSEGQRYDEESITSIIYNCVNFIERDVPEDDASFSIMREFTAVLCEGEISASDIRARMEADKAEELSSCERSFAEARDRAREAFTFPEKAYYILKMQEAAVRARRNVEDFYRYQSVLPPVA